MNRPAGKDDSLEDRRRHAKQVTAFGAAISALVVSHAPAAEATVVDLTPNVFSIINAYAPFGGGATVTIGDAGFFSQYNDSIGKSLGINDNLFWRFTAASNNVPTYGFYGALRINESASGIQYFAFRTPSNQFGWIKMDLGGVGGDIHYLAGAYNDTPSGTIHVGTMNGSDPVPEPATTGLLALGVLALGARGVRRLRAERRSSTATAQSS